LRCFDRFAPPEDVEGEVMVVEAAFEDGSVSLTTPEGLAEGDCKVFVSFDGQRGHFFDAGLFTVA
jgi:hypothetical protein